MAVIDSKDISPLAFGSTDAATFPQIPLIHSLSSYPYLPHGYVGEMVGIALASAGIWVF